MHHSSKFYLVVTLCWLLSFVAQAQLWTFKRHEITQDKKSPQIETSIALEHWGIALVASENDGFHHKRWHFTLLDTAFNTQLNGNYQLASPLDFNESFHSDSLLYLLFSRPESHTECVVFKWNLRSGYLGTYNVRLPMQMKINGLFAHLDNVYFVGTAKNRETIVQYNMESRETIVLSSLFEQELHINSLLAESNTEPMHVVLSRKHRSKQQLWFKSYDGTGQIVADSPLSSFGEKNPTQLRTLWNDSVQAQLGGYYYTFASDQPQGFWLQSVSLATPTDTSQRLKFLPFTSLLNYSAYKSPKKQANEREEITEKLVKGKEFRFHHRWQLNTAQFIPQDSVYLLLGERYFLTHGNQFQHRPYGNPAYFGNNDFRMLDEYRYTHGHLTVLDKNKNYLWDWGFEMPEQQHQRPSQNVFAQPSDSGGVVVLMSKGDKLSSLFLRNGKMLHKTEDIIYPRTLYPNDQDTDNIVLHKVSTWHKDYFVMCGTQTVRNTETAGISPNRKVFFLLKLRYKSSVK